MRRLLPLVLVAALLLGACGGPGAGDSSHGATAQQTATPTPLAVRVQRVALAGHAVDGAVAATTRGFVFGETDHDAQGSPVSALYYDDLDGGAIKKIDAAPWDPNRPTGPHSGSDATIDLLGVSGDLAVYVHIGVSGAPLKLIAMDVAHDRQFTLMTTTGQLAGGESQFAAVDTDGRRVAWALPPLFTGGRLGATTVHLLDTSTGAKQDLALDAGSLYKFALSGDSLAYAKIPPDAAQGMQFPLFRVKIVGGTPEQLATLSDNLALAGNERYVAWDEINEDGSGTTSALDVQATSRPPMRLRCTRPRLAGRYLACVAWGKNIQLHDLATGAYAIFAAGEHPLSVTLSPGRAVWSGANDTVEYAMLPAQ